MTRRITHFGIVVNDAAAACDLWCDSFGMKKAGDMQIAEEGIRSVFISVDGTAGLVYSSFNGVHGFEWLFLALGLFADLASYAGGGYQNQRRTVAYN